MPPRPLHLLVTDDDVDKRMLLTRAIGREFPHASIFECHSGKEALDYFNRNHVYAIITNHNMQPIDGIQLVTTLRGGQATLPIIMVSGHGEVKEAALSAGVDLFLDSRDLFGIGKPIAAFLRQRGVLDTAEPEAKT